MVEGDFELDPETRTLAARAFDKIDLEGDSSEDLTPEESALTVLFGPKNPNVERVDWFPGLSREHRRELREIFGEGEQST